MVDGSWSIGDDNFNKIINFLYSTVGALDKIGADGTQVRPASRSLHYPMHLDIILSLLPWSHVRGCNRRTGMIEC